MGIGTGSADTLLPDAITLVVANVIAATNTRNVLITLRLVVHMIRVIVLPPKIDCDVPPPRERGLPSGSAGWHLLGTPLYMY